MIKAIVKFIEYDKEAGTEQVIAEQEVKFRHDETIGIKPDTYQLYPGYYVKDFRLFLDCNALKEDGSNPQKIRSSIGGLVTLEGLQKDWKKTSDNLIRSLSDMDSQVKDLKNFLGTIKKQKSQKRGRPKKPIVQEKIADVDVPF